MGDGKGASGRIPTAPQATRIAELFKRRLTTPWTDKEVRAFKRLMPIDIADLDMVCRYHEAERSKGDDGHHRRDMGTFLNNFTTELDRARAWESKPNGTGQSRPFTSANAPSL